MACDRRRRSALEAPLSASSNWFEYRMVAVPERLRASYPHNGAPSRHVSASWD